MIQVRGVLLDPLGSPQGGVTIKVTAQSGNSVLAATSGSVVTTSDGAYSFNLVEGMHLVEVNFSEEYTHAGEVTVTPEMEGLAYDLNGLFGDLVPVGLEEDTPINPAGFNSFKKYNTWV